MILDVKGSMITTKRTTDQKLVTCNSSSFKKLQSTGGSHPRIQSSVPQVKLQALLDFNGPESIEHTQMPATQEEFCQATPSETSPVKDDHLPTTVEQPPPSLPAFFSCSGR